MYILTFYKSYSLKQYKKEKKNNRSNRGKVYARTHSKEATHLSFGPVKSLYQSFAHLVPDDVALYGESIPFHPPPLLLLPFLSFASRALRTPADSIAYYRARRPYSLYLCLSSFLLLFPPFLYLNFFDNT
jgi:hypothetical protein